MADKRVQAAFHEVYNKVPKNVKKTGKTGEAKRKMMTAIALSKARAAGAKIPKMHDGGQVSKSGVYELKEGEMVIPAGKEGSLLPNVRNEFSGTSYGLVGGNQPKKQQSGITSTVTDGGAGEAE